MGVTAEMDNGLTPDRSHSRPVDVLVARWEKSLSAAKDIAATSPLSPAILEESCLTAGCCRSPQTCY